jgi:amidase
MPWTIATPKFKDRIAEADAIPVARARAAGAAILGKVNTPELGAAISTVNDLFPATQNPWRDGVSPGGSSGGSAAAVAAGLATVAFGDDLGGSIRIPSSCCGTVGLRPSPGRVPNELPNPTGFDSRGPIARSVRDCRLVFAVMTREEPPPQGSPEHLRVALVDSSPLRIHPACLAAARRAAAALEACGHRVEQVPWDPAPVAEGYRVVRRVSIAAFPARPDELGTRVRGLAEEGHRVSGVDYFLAHQKATAAARRNVNDLFESGFDALVTPTLGLLPLRIEEMPSFLGEDWDVMTQFVLPVSFSRLPAVSVPAGLEDGLPVGVQLVGAYREEWRLLDLAAQLEAAEGFGFSRPPGW